MKITRLEVDGEMYRVTKSVVGQTYCEECGLEDKCSRKDNKVFPCNIIGEEEIFVKDETNI